MTIDELQAKIEEADRIKAKLKEELESRRAADREIYVMRVRADLAALGMTPKDLMVMLAVSGEPAARGARKTRKPSPVRVLKADPGKVYRGGALPEWMKTAMAKTGLNETRKEDRQRFIAEHMQVAA